MNLNEFGKKVECWEVKLLSLEGEIFVQFIYGNKQILYFNIRVGLVID